MRDTLHSGRGACIFVTTPNRTRNDMLRLQERWIGEFFGHADHKTGMNWGLWTDGGIHQSTLSSWLTPEETRHSGTCLLNRTSRWVRQFLIVPLERTCIQVTLNRATLTATNGGMHMKA